MCIRCVDGSEDEHINEVAFEEPKWKSYWDDLTGRELNRSTVEAARAEELAVVKKMQVWRKVRREECFQATGRPPIELKWADINKGDELHPKYKSRIVAKEIKTDNRPELFAATPPLEFIKHLISRCASRQRRAKPPANDTGYQQGSLLCTSDQGHLHRAPTRRGRAGNCRQTREVAVRHERCGP